MSCKTIGVTLHELDNEYLVREGKEKNFWVLRRDFMF